MNLNSAQSLVWGVPPDPMRDIVVRDCDCKSRYFFSLPRPLIKLIKVEVRICPIDRITQDRIASASDLHDICILVQIFALASSHDRA